MYFLFAGLLKKNKEKRPRLRQKNTSCWIYRNDAELSLQLKSSSNMKRIHAIVFFALLLSQTTWAQGVVRGSFSGLAGQKISLEGYRGTDTHTIAVTTADAQGNFALPYAREDHGRAFLLSADNKSYFIVLTGEALAISGKNFLATAEIRIEEGGENQLLVKYLAEQTKREQALYYWVNLEKMYEGEVLSFIRREQERIHSEDSLFLAQLDPDSYVSWYLPLRKLISLAATRVKYQPEAIPAILDDLRKVDFGDVRLYQSGLLKEVLDYQFQLIRQSGWSEERKQRATEESIDLLIAKVKAEEEKMNMVAAYLFEAFEKRSFSEAAAYLSNRVLDDASCTVSEDLNYRLESYRLMKVGNKAPDIVFGEGVSTLGGVSANSLKALPAVVKIVVFGAGWCQHCQQEIPRMVELYQKWKPYGVEVVFVSLDENAANFKAFAGNFPFISISDFKSWDSPIVRDYHIYATPTIFMLNKELVILEKPQSVKAVNDWLMARSKSGK